MAGIRIENVRKSYGAVTVLRDFNLDIADGEFVVFVGPSGCGKSTMLKILAGLEEASGGRVLIGERDVTDLAPGDRDIAMVFQNYALYPHLTVARNMGFGLKMRGMDRGEIDRRVKEAAKILAVDHLLERRPKELSGGRPSSWTNRSRTSTRSSGCTCVPRSAPCTSASASPPSTSPTTRSRP